MSWWERTTRAAKRSWNGEKSTLADHIMLWGTIGLVLTLASMIVSAL